MELTNSGLATLSNCGDYVWRSTHARPRSFGELALSFGVKARQLASLLYVRYPVDSPSIALSTFSSLQPVSIKSIDVLSNSHVQWLVQSVFILVCEIFGFKSLPFSVFLVNSLRQKTNESTT